MKDLNPVMRANSMKRLSCRCNNQAVWVGVDIFISQQLFLMINMKCRPVLCCSKFLLALYCWEFSSYWNHLSFWMKIVIGICDDVFVFNKCLSVYCLCFGILIHTVVLESNPIVKNQRTLSQGVIEVNFAIKLNDFGLKFISLQK